jgi:hypothetical protein
MINRRIVKLAPQCSTALIRYEQIRRAAMKKA